MNSRATKFTVIITILILVCFQGYAMIDGITGPNFTLTAKSGYINTPEGNSILIWGYANDAGMGMGMGMATVQYPGPTLIVKQGEAVSITLNNELTVPVSIVFPGQKDVVKTPVSGAVTQGILTLEAAPGGSVRYTFIAAEPGTYHYHSGTQPELQVEMGLVGALIVRPVDEFGDVLPHQAYNHMDSMYDHEYLFLLTEMDPNIHEMVELGRLDVMNNTKYFPTYWFINGRCAPDTMLPAHVSWLPNQPYNCMPMMHPGEKLLMRVIGGGRDLHPFHHHGNHSRLIARDGRLLSSSSTLGANLSFEVFTVQTSPGKTYDAIFEWTGEKLGWDIYGHAPEDPLEMNEYAPDHGKPFPVALPDTRDLTFGGMWSGSPFLGSLASLPPGEGGLNPDGGYTYMWHSHTEKEMVNNDIFPGGMMTMLMIVSHNVPIHGDMGMMGVPVDRREDAVSPVRSIKNIKVNTKGGLEQ